MQLCSQGVDLGGIDVHVELAPDAALHQVFRPFEVGAGQGNLRFQLLHLGPVLDGIDGEQHVAFPHPDQWPDRYLEHFAVHVGNDLDHRLVHANRARGGAPLHRHKQDEEQQQHPQYRRDLPEAVQLDEADLDGQEQYDDVDQCEEDNHDSSPSLVALSGSGWLPAASLPTRLAFGLL